MLFAIVITKKCVYRVHLRCLRELRLWQLKLFLITFPIALSKEKKNHRETTLLFYLQSHHITIMHCIFQVRLHFPNSLRSWQLPIWHQNLWFYKSMLTGSKASSPTRARAEGLLRGTVFPHSLNRDIPVDGLETQNTKWQVSELGCIHPDSSGESEVCGACLACTISRYIRSRAITAVRLDQSESFLELLIQQQFLRTNVDPWGLCIKLPVKKKNLQTKWSQLVITFIYYVTHIAHSHMAFPISNQLGEIKWYKTKSSALSWTKYSPQYKSSLIRLHFIRELYLRFFKSLMMKLLFALNFVWPHLKISSFLPTLTVYLKF